MAKNITAGRWFLQVINSLEASGHDCQLLCEQVGIDYCFLKNNDGRINIDLAFNFWEALANQSNDPLIGLSLVKNMNIGAFKALGFSLLASETLKEAMERLVRYQKIMGDARGMSLHRGEGCYSIEIALTGNERSAPHHPIDASFAFLLSQFRWLLNRDLRPQSVLLMRSAPPDSKAYEQAFHCMPKFLQQKNAIVLSQEDLESRLPTADKALASMQEKILSHDLAQLHENDLTESVRKLIINKLPSGDVKLEDILPYFSMQKRTFQRKLKQQGYTFFQLVDEIRMDKAKQYIIQPGMAFEEVAFLLGFSEHANFSRAFKRWFNCTPGQYRSQMNS